MTDWKQYEMIKQGYVLVDYRVVHNNDRTVFVPLLVEGYLPCGELQFQCVGLRNPSVMKCESRLPMCLWKTPSEAKAFLLDKLNGSSLSPP